MGVGRKSARKFLGHFVRRRGAPRRLRRYGVTIAAAWLMQRPAASARMISFYAYVE